MAHALPVELIELLERAAAHPDGTEPLLRGDVECAACLYLVAPEQVELARSAMRNPELRPLASQILGRPRAPATTDELPRLKDLSTLFMAAMNQPHGMEVLLEAPIEQAAAQFAAPAILVDAARTRLKAHA